MSFSTQPPNSSKEGEGTFSAPSLLCVIRIRTANKPSLLCVLTHALKVAIILLFSIIYANISLENIMLFFGKHRENIFNYFHQKKELPKQETPFNLLIISISLIDYSSIAAWAAANGYWLSMTYERTGQHSECKSYTFCTFLTRILLQKLSLT